MKIQQQQKLPRRFYQAEHHRWEFLTFPFKKKNYRSVISITFIPNIVFHLMVISTLNKSND